MYKRTNNNNNKYTRIGNKVVVKPADLQACKFNLSLSTG